jgi:hypothetical protein
VDTVVPENDAVHPTKRLIERRDIHATGSQSTCSMYGIIWAKVEVHNQLQAVDTDAGGEGEFIPRELFEESLKGRKLSFEIVSANFSLVPLIEPKSLLQFCAKSLTKPRLHHYVGIFKPQQRRSKQGSPAILSDVS